MLDKFAKYRELDLEEGRQFNLTEKAKKAGLPFKVFITSGIWNVWVKPDKESLKRGESEDVRLHEILHRLVYAIRTHRQGNRSNILNFKVSLTRHGKSENVELLSYLGPISFENNNPCITLMLSDEVDS